MLVYSSLMKPNLIPKFIYFFISFIIWFLVAISDIWIQIQVLVVPLTVKLMMLKQVKQTHPRYVWEIECLSLLIEWYHYSSSILVALFVWFLLDDILVLCTAMIHLCSFPGTRKLVFWTSVGWRNQSCWYTWETAWVIVLDLVVCHLLAES